MIVILLLPDTDLAGSLAAAEKIRAAIASVQVPGVDRPITASIGAAAFPEDAADVAGLTRIADRGLYAAKDMIAPGRFASRPNPTSS